MSKQYNGKNLPLAKTLRKNATPQEKRLWYDFLRTYPIRFQRQKMIGEYIVDFYCHRAKLVIEIDGSQHYSEENIKQDMIRTEELEHRGLKVVRFTNREIDTNLQGVCDSINLTVRESLA